MNPHQITFLTSCWFSMFVGFLFWYFWICLRNQSWTFSCNFFIYFTLSSMSPLNYELQFYILNYFLLISTTMIGSKQEFHVNSINRIFVLKGNRILTINIFKWTIICSLASKPIVGNSTWVRRITLRKSLKLWLATYAWSIRGWQVELCWRLVANIN